MLGGGGRKPRDGLASHPGGVVILLVAQFVPQEDGHWPDTDYSQLSLAN